MAVLKYYIIAGEASGDLHGANLMRGMLRHDPDCEIRFWGGEQMAEVGGTLVRDYRETAVMGIVEVLKHLRKISGNLAFCKKDILSWQPDAVILIDYPGFNLKIAEFAHRHGIATFYYIPPKVWARGASRIELLKKYIDRTFIIFPFEQEYFRSRGLDVSYHGNPLTDNIAQSPSVCAPRTAFLQQHGLPDRRSIALLAGSRKMEIEYLLPRMIRTIEMLDRHWKGERQYLLAAAPATDSSYYQQIIDRHATPSTPRITIIRNDTYGVLKHSDAAIISSGTASLEAAIIGTPQVVCYGLNPITYAIGKRIVKLDTVSLANLILGRHIFRELLQDACTPENITAEVIRLTEDRDYISSMKKDYAAMMEQLGEQGSAERNAQEIEIRTREIHDLKTKEK